MSRIEKAMERAAQLRRGEVDRREVTTRPQPDAPVHVPPPVDEALERVRSDNPLLVTLNAPGEPVCEEYRKLKAALVKMTRGEGFENVIMITSAVPGEGKSVTALNLAISMAQEFDHTVLLIDADLRRPMVHSYLNIEKSRGLADCLTGQCGFGEVLIPTGIGRLSVVTAGCPVSNPVELFSSNRMKTLLDEIKHRYPDRYIIFDTPPLLPFAETRSLAHLVDGVVLVVKEMRATQTNVRDAVEALKGCRLLGTVYNDTVMDQSLEGYYSYRYRYGQGAGLKAGAHL